MNNSNNMYNQGSGMPDNSGNGLQSYMPPQNLPQPNNLNTSNNGINVQAGIPKFSPVTDNNINVMPTGNNTNNNFGIMQPNNNNNYENSNIGVGRPSFNPAVENNPVNVAPLTNANNNNLGIIQPNNNIVNSNNGNAFTNSGMSNSISQIQVQNIPANNIFANIPDTNNGQNNNVTNNVNNNVYNGVNTNNINTNNTNINNVNANNESPIAPVTNFNNKYTSNFNKSSNGPSSDLASDEELLEVFIGKNYDKITSKPFNFAGLFLSNFYLFYRKMYGYALLVFILYVAISILTKMPALSFGINILVGFLVNKLYISYATKKITKIKLKKSSLSNEDLKNYIKKKGGTSIIAVIVGSLIELILGYLIIITLMFFGLSLIIGNLPGMINNINTGSDSEYSGVLMTDIQTNIANEFTISVPSVFSNDSSSYEYSYKYSGNDGVYNACKLSVYSVMGHKNARILINQIASYDKNNNPSLVTKKTINNLDWYWFQEEDTFGKTYYYGANKNNKVFIMKYEANADSPSDCEKYRETIINSIKSK